MGYVVSDQFYKNELPLEDKFEDCLYRYIKQDIIDPLELINLAKDAYNWSTEKQFYRIPIIIKMLKTYRHNMVTGV